MIWQWAILCTGLLQIGCAMHSLSSPKVEPRRGDEMIVAGQMIHTGARIVLWTDPGGFDAYPSRHFAERDRVREGAWDLPMLRETIDQFVIHYDACGSSARCFEVLEQRGLSVQFMLDVDGTIYQTMDLKERAWHATRSNSRSVGIEIANIGAYPLAQRETIDAWYRGHSVTPARTAPVSGMIQDQQLVMYDLTDAQYEALIKLTAALCETFPAIRCDYPRDSDGQLIDHVLTDEQWGTYRGLIGHFHIQRDKVDPGPAFDWDRVARGVETLLEAPRERGR